MNDTREFISDFDLKYGLMSISARIPVYIDNRIQLHDLLIWIDSQLREVSTNNRCYLAIDISRLVVDPSQINEFKQKLQVLSDRYLCAEGLVKYGFQISRTDGSMSSYVDSVALVRTHQEAREYVIRLRNRLVLKKPVFIQNS
jgi:hypothetical protein